MDNSNMNNNMNYNNMNDNNMNYNNTNNNNMNYNANGSGYYPPNMPVQNTPNNDPDAKMAMIMGIISLCASVLGIIFFWSSCTCAGNSNYTNSFAFGYLAALAASGILSVGAVVTGIVAAAKASKYNKLAAQTGNYASKSNATAGLVCGIIGIIVAAMSIISCVSCFGCATCIACSAGEYLSESLYSMFVI